MNDAATLFLGVDPGAKGAMALVDLAGCFVDRFRTEKATRREQTDWLRGYAPLIRMATLENVTGGAKHAGAAFKLGNSAGFFEGLLLGLHIPFEKHTSPSWQQRMRCRTGGDKAVSRAKAQELFPDAQTVLAKGRGTGITDHEADAILIAEDCRRLTLGLYLTRGKES